MTQRSFALAMKKSREIDLVEKRLLWSKVQARSEQLPPENLSWSSFVYCAGRGAGKTRAASEWLIWNAILKFSRWAVIAPTMHSCVSVCVEGESGLLAVLQRYGLTFEFKRSRREIHLENGSLISIFSAEEPDRLRGPQFHGAWFDELASFGKPEIYEIALATLRLGESPQHLITTTPKPTTLMLKLTKLKEPRRIVRFGSTFDNASNLPESFLNDIKDYYGDSKLARQELYGEILDDLEGALFTREILENSRVATNFSDLQLYRHVIGVDPAVTYGDNSNLTGIVVVGQEPNGECYVLEDASMRAKPEQWSQKIGELSIKYSSSLFKPLVIAEINNGGDLVESVLRQSNPNLNLKVVRASEGKTLRAEPVSIAYSKGKIHHLGNFPELEEQMLYWLPGISSKSPDRMDALVWALTYLLTEESHSLKWLFSKSNICRRCNNVYAKTNLICPSCHLPSASN